MWAPAEYQSITDSYLGCHSSLCNCHVASADTGVPMWLGLHHWPLAQAQPGQICLGEDPCPVYPSSRVCPRVALTWGSQPCWGLTGHWLDSQAANTKSCRHRPLTTLLLSWGNPCASMATISNSEEDPCKGRQPGQSSPGNGSPRCPPHKERHHQEHSRGADPSFQVHACF